MQFVLRISVHNITKADFHRVKANANPAKYYTAVKIPQNYPELAMQRKIMSHILYAMTSFKIQQDIKVQPRNYNNSLKYGQVTYIQ